MGIASLVLGLVSLVIAVFFSYAGWLATVLGIIGIILGAIGSKSEAKLSTGGLVCSIIGAALGLLMYIACVGCVGSLGGLL